MTIKTITNNNYLLSVKKLNELNIFPSSKKSGIMLEKLLNSII